MSSHVTQRTLDNFADEYECVDCGGTPRWDFNRTEMNGDDVCLDCVLERIKETDEEIERLMEIPI